MSRGIWIGILAVIILLGLGAWWLSANQVVTLPTLPATATSSDATASSTASAGQYYPTTTSGSSVAAIAENLSGASTFGGWLSSTGVGAKLSGKGPYTIFVPTDGSISQLPAGTYNDLSAADKMRFVEYHIVTGRAIDATAETAGAIQAMSGDALNFSYGADNIPMVDSAIIIAEYKGTNGVVYLVSNPMLPPQK